MKYKKILAGALLLFLQFNAWAFVIHPGADQTICPGESVTLGDNPLVTGGSGNYTYTWTEQTGGTLVSSLENPIVNPTATTIYEIAVTDNESGIMCSDIAIVNVWMPTSIMYVDSDPTSILAPLSDGDVLKLCETYTFTVDPAIGSGQINVQLIDTDPIIFDETVVSQLGTSLTYTFDPTLDDDGAMTIRFWCDENGNGSYDGGELSYEIDFTLEDVMISSVKYTELFNVAPYYKYGFDDRTLSVDEPWKSIEKGQTDIVQGNILPAANFQQVEFYSEDLNKVTVAPVTLPSAADQLTLTAGNTLGETRIKSKKKCDESIIDDHLCVVNYEKKTATVSVRVVHSGGTVPYTSTDIPDADIIDFLNNVCYNQAVFEWTVTRLPAMTVDFDLNMDGMIDVNPPPPADGWMTAEMIVIRDNAADPAYDYNLFFVDNPSDGSLGYMGYGQMYGFVHADAGADDTGVVAHELGHGAFSLQHTTPDIDNIMHDTSTGKFRLRKDQWDLIQ